MTAHAAPSALFHARGRQLCPPGHDAPPGRRSCADVEPGLVEIWLPYSDRVTQQQDGFHGGAMGAVADIAGGYAGLTLAPEGMEVVTAEYKINFLGSYQGGALRAIGRVVKPGRRLIITSAEVGTSTTPARKAPAP
jgi:uncharacterized protein (TIGR00369 family)